MIKPVKTVCFFVLFICICVNTCDMNVKGFIFIELDSVDSIHVKKIEYLAVFSASLLLPLK